MNAAAPTLDDLIDQLRANAEKDVQLAQRVAMACCLVIERRSIRSRRFARHVESVMTDFTAYEKTAQIKVS